MDMTPTQAEALKQWTEEVDSAFANTLAELKTQFATLEGMGVDSDLVDAVKTLMAMQTFTALSLTLNTQVLTSSVIALLPEDKRERAQEGMQKMREIVQEHAIKAMDGIEI